MPYRSDQELAGAVREEVELDPTVVVRDLGITVTDGEVTLIGGADTYDQLWQAERAVARVRGVRGVVNEIVVTPAADPNAEDRRLAEAVNAAFARDGAVPPGRSAPPGWSPGSCRSRVPSRSPRRKPPPPRFAARSPAPSIATPTSPTTGSR